jgi:mono/diheme cytochrome c family protein
VKIALLVVLAGCDWGLARMNDQPRCEPGDTTKFLPDGRCDHAPPQGTVAWRSIEQNVRIAPTRAVIERGADRFAKFCAPCHGVFGDGRSPVAADMLLRPPPSLHEERLIAVTDDFLAQVIQQGYGLMPSYARVLPSTDRWAVVHYVRTLQTSGRVALDTLSPEDRARAMRALAVAEGSTRPEGTR